MGIYSHGQYLKPQLGDGVGLPGRFLIAMDFLER
jgi:hypothetical protein